MHINRMKKVLLFVIFFIAFFCNIGNVKANGNYFYFETYIDNNGNILYSDDNTEYDNTVIAQIGYQGNNKWTLLYSGINNSLTSKSEMSPYKHTWWFGRPERYDYFFDFEGPECNSDYVALKKDENGEYKIFCISNEEGANYQSNMYDDLDTYHIGYINNGERIYDGFIHLSSYDFSVTQSAYADDSIWLFGKKLPILSSTLLTIVEYNDNRYVVPRTITDDKKHSDVVHGSNINPKRIYVFSKKKYSYEYNDNYSKDLAKKLNEVTKNLNSKDSDYEVMLSRFDSDSYYSKVSYDTSHTLWKNKIQNMYNEIKTNCGAKDNEVLNSVSSFSNNTDICKSKVEYLNRARITFNKWWKLNEQWSFNNSISNESIDEINNSNDKYAYRDNEYLLFYEFHTGTNLHQSILDALKAANKLDDIKDECNDEDTLKNDIYNGILNYCQKKNGCNPNPVAPSATKSTQEQLACDNKALECAIEYKNFFYDNYYEKVKSQCKNSFGNWCLGSCILSAGRDNIKGNTAGLSKEVNDNHLDLATVLDSIRIEKKWADLDTTKKETEKEVEKIFENIEFAKINNVSVRFSDVVVDCKDFKVANYAWSFIIILAPFLTIVFSIIDFFKIVVSSDESAKKSMQKNFPKRILALTLLILIPLLIKVMFSIMGDNGRMVKILNCIVNGE